MLFFLLSLIATASLAAPGSQRPLNDEGKYAELHGRGNPLTEKLGSYVESLLDNFKVPSLAVAVVDGDRTYSAAYGTAIFPSTPATPETLYYGGSTTKSFTAAAMLLLAHWSANSTRPLRLTDPIHRHLPNFQLQSDYATLHTTIEDMLSHRSGLPRHDLAYAGQNYTMEDLLAAIRHLPLTAEPRTKFQYNNIMFMLAARIIENFAHIPLGEFFTANIWKPLEMRSTYLSLADAQEAEKHDGKQLARGYYWDEYDDAYREQPWMNAPLVAGAGNIISNVLDYAKYLTAMINQQPPIPAEGYEQLRTARTIVEGHGSGPFPATAFNSTFPGGFAYTFTGAYTYTLGWEQRVYRGVEMYLHDGGVIGFGAQMAYIPSLKWAVALLGNTEVRSNLIETILLYRLLDDRLGVPISDRHDREPAFKSLLALEKIKFLNSTKRLYPDVPEPPIPLSRPLEDYEGEYWNPGYRNLTFSLVEATYPGAATQSLALGTDLWDQVWSAHAQLQHVTGEHFVLWTLPLKEKPIEFAKGACKAEFKVGANGRIQAVGVAIEPMMEEEKMWFQRMG